MDMELETNETSKQRAAEILRKLNARKGRRSLPKQIELRALPAQEVSIDTSDAKSPKKKKKSKDNASVDGEMAFGREEKEKKLRHVDAMDTDDVETPKTTEAESTNKKKKRKSESRSDHVEQEVPVTARVEAGTAKKKMKRKATSGEMPATAEDTVKDGGAMDSSVNLAKLSLDGGDSDSEVRVDAAGDGDRKSGSDGATSSDEDTARRVGGDVNGASTAGGDVTIGAMDDGDENGGWGGDVNGDSDADEATGPWADSGFTVLEEVERLGRAQVHRVLPDWLDQPTVVPNQSVPGLPCRPELCSELREKLTAAGIKAWFPIQAAVIPYLLSTLDSPLPPPDVCVSAPTGSGKTLAFALPLIQALRSSVVRRVRALVVLPTQPLAAQVAAVFRQYSHGLPLGVRLLGADSLTKERDKLVTRGPRGFVSQADIVVTTPGRLMDHLAYTEGFSLGHLRYLVIDEADRVIEMAETGWLKAVERATVDPLGAPRRPASAPLTAASLTSPHLPVQKLLFSATLSQNPEKLERLGLFQPKLFVCGPDPNATPSGTGQFIGKFTTPAQLKESFTVCPPQVKPLVLHHLLTERPWERVLVFTNSTESAHRLSLLLSALDCGGVAEFSARLTPQERKVALRQLVDGSLKALVCSDAMARGMDVERVDAVVSYDIPALVKTYVHRVGRTARAGLPGEAVTILLPKQQGHFSRLLQQAGKPSDMNQLEVSMDQLKQLQERYIEALQKVERQVQREQEEQRSKLHRAGAEKKCRGGKTKKRARKRRKAGNAVQGANEVNKS